MKRFILLIITAVCNVSTVMSNDNHNNYSYDLQSYVIDSVDIEINNKRLGYKLSFEIRNDRMRCYISEEGDIKNNDREMTLPDSAAVYSDIKRLFIENCPQKYDIIKELDSPFSDKNIVYIELSTYIYINGIDFWNSQELGDIYSSKEQEVRYDSVVYSKPFRRFMQRLDKRVAKEVGGDMAKKYKKMIKKIKKENPHEIILK